MKTENKQDEMMSYMTNKYGETFDFVNIDTQVWSADYTEMIVHSTIFPGKRIVIHKEKKGGEISDNFVALLLNNDIQKELSKTIKEIYGENIVFNIPTQDVLPSNFNKSTTTNEYLQNINSDVDITFFVCSPTNTKKEDAEKLRKIFKDKLFPISFTIIYVTGDILKTISASNYTSFTSSNSTGVLARGEFVMNSNFDFTLNKWGSNQ